MTAAYPGELARRRCAARTREELLSYHPTRPLALRDALRLRGMAARCATCQACPRFVRTLKAMAADAQPPSEPTPAHAASTSDLATLREAAALREAS
jgi:hypothetical protein